MQRFQSFIGIKFLSTWWKVNRPRKAHQLDPSVLNTGLSRAFSADGSWRLPLQSQLCKLYPGMAWPELDEYHQACQDVIQTGITLACQPAPQSRYRGILPVSRTQTQAWKNYHQGMRHHYPWISETNLHSIFSFARSGTAGLQHESRPHLQVA
ncbi:MAG: hypothetical protein AAF649_09270 [Verrucomicrobiota bacterium]